MHWNMLLREANWWFESAYYYGSESLLYPVHVHTHTHTHTSASWVSSSGQEVHSLSVQMSCNLLCLWHQSYLPQSKLVRTHIQLWSGFHWLCIPILYVKMVVYWLQVTNIRILYDLHKCHQLLPNCRYTFIYPASEMHGWLTLLQHYFFPYLMYSCFPAYRQPACQLEKKNIYTYVAATHIPVITAPSFKQLTCNWWSGEG